MTHPAHDAAEPQGSIIACPKCAAAMEQVTVGDVVIDRCRGCGGLWLDAMERERLLASADLVKAADTGSEKIGRELDDQTNVHCPRDRSRMIHMVDLRQRHIGYESCQICGGVFLDAGELRDLASFTLIERIRSILG
ncbi:MAG: zf-TFIIB domain-containing protein [Phycisphaeraceae bacterium]|nr:zf-TFIIB domain-containing protein [Phycisphaeraceae bacterium]MCW5755229.1 zf-TFIIB domain-containing protein [Phycisphaeraceae bacterium]